MTTLKAGVLLKLINGMTSGTKPTNEHRSSLLQVIDIVPIDLDDKDLWPKHGFYVKLSDSSHSVYVTLPFEKDDLVLSNKLQLGQFVYVEKLDPGLPVPVVRGVKPIPGRHPFVGTPEPLLGFGEKSDEKGNLGSDRGSNLSSRLASPRRGSWVTGLKGEDSVCGSGSPKVLKPSRLEVDPVKIRGSVNMKTSSNILASRRNSRVLGQKGDQAVCAPPMALKQSPLKFNQCTPVKDRSSMIGVISDEKRSSNRKASLSKVMDTPVAVKKSSVTSPMVNIPKSKSRIFDNGVKTVTTLNSAGKKSVTPPSSRSTRAASYPKSCVEVKECPSTELISQVESPYDDSSFKIGLSFNLPQKLSLLGKEAVLQQERAQKVALQALRNASATETLVWSLKALSNLTKSANPEDPTDCFDQFLDFHKQIVEAITDMISIKAATEMIDKEENTQILHEIMNNDPNSNNKSKRKSTLHKAIAAFPGRSHQKSTNLGKSRSSIVDQKVKLESCYKNENKNNDTIKLGKQIEIEAGNWFMEFLEKALEKGMKKTKLKTKKVPEFLIMKVLNWVEVEQCDSSKRPVHPRAIEISRKLRIKVKST
uniref:uncharacterized protein LOC122595390 n=1 Tax=Erigeron canadensis TaxID=72917 RepID=UPI001CB93F71|nr:uncharacterized protein LOC122595390 [Erigeron canadensis]